MYFQKRQKYLSSSVPTLNLVFRSRLKLPLHPLAASHYFNQYFARFDTMHVNDLRGTIAIAGGSLLVHLVTRIRALGNTQQQRMDDINKSMREFQKGRTEHRMPNLRLTDLRTDKGWSMLCGKLVKAANTRAMLPFLNGLAQTHCTGRDGFDSSCNKVFTSLMTIQRIMYSSGTFLTDEAKEEFKDAHLRLGRHWQLLRQLCERAGVNSFQNSQTALHATLSRPSQSHQPTRSAKLYSRVSHRSSCQSVERMCEWTLRRHCAAIVIGASMGRLRTKDLRRRRRFDITTKLASIRLCA